jgi:uncharacterized protein YqjF (DUF2071 family)
VSEHLRQPEPSRSQDDLLWHAGVPPVPIRFSVMRQDWRTLTFLHWRYDPAIVQALLPQGLQVHTNAGSAWVGLVPFRITVRGPIGPALPWLGGVPETNVRTYVVGPDGRPGVWFFSLDIVSPHAVAAARLAWGLPYYWSRMSVVEAGDEITYRCQRRSARGTTRSLTRVRIGDPIAPDAIDEFEHFLTARFALWTRHLGMLTYTRAEHARWPLHRAAATEIDDSLVAASGLPSPAGEPLVHYSPGVSVEIGGPRLVRR